MSKIASWDDEPYLLKGETITITTTESGTSTFATTISGFNGTTTSDIGKVAVKFDNGKTDWSLMPFEAVEEINKVLEFGKHKYSAWNWASNGGFKYTRVLNATLRHLFAFMRGEDKDPESGLSHIAHAGCNILFLMYFIKNKDKYNTNDDRNIV